MLGWMLLGAAGLAVLGKVSDNTKAENNSFQNSTKANNYSQYVTLQLVAMPEYETYIYVDDLLFCRVHHENPHSYVVNDIPVGCKLSDGTLWEGQIALYFRWTCLPDCAVPELEADYRRNNRRLS